MTILYFSDTVKYWHNKTKELEKQIQEQTELIQNLNSRLEEIESEKMSQLENQLQEMFEKW